MATKDTGFAAQQNDEFVSNLKRFTIIQDETLNRYHEFMMWAAPKIFENPNTTKEELEKINELIDAIKIAQNALSDADENIMKSYYFN